MKYSNCFSTGVLLHSPISLFCSKKKTVEAKQVRYHGIEEKEKFSLSFFLCFFFFLKVKF